MTLSNRQAHHYTRRDFLLRGVGGLAALGLTGFAGGCLRQEYQTSTFISRVNGYNASLALAIITGMRELGITRRELADKTILLKPNLVEVIPGRSHINTSPAVVRGAIEAFLHFGAKHVLVGEGPGHSRDTLGLAEDSRLLDVLREDRIRFVDLNYDDVFTIENKSKFSDLKRIHLPSTLRQVDWVVSMPKLKTHHWAGITVSMKNLFGLMPGIYYGWPKNVLHYAGLNETILDINSAVRPNFAIVDGIIGMEGDGPIMGTPRKAGVIIMGRNLTAVDATAARVMGIDPKRVSYLSKASGRLGPIEEKNIIQYGESLRSVITRFELDRSIPAHKNLIS